MPRDNALIMVVDDDEDVREVIELMFKSAGYRVITAADGLEAWREICLGEQPDLILLDLMMPRMDGEHFMHMLRGSAACAIPVVIMSGHTSARDKARELRADHCLSKPIDLDELMATVARFVARAPEHGAHPSGP